MNCPAVGGTCGLFRKTLGATTPAIAIRTFAPREPRGIGGATRVLPKTSSHRQTNRIPTAPKVTCHSVASCCRPVYRLRQGYRTEKGASLTVRNVSCHPTFHDAHPSLVAQSTRKHHPSVPTPHPEQFVWASGKPDHAASSPVVGESRDAERRPSRVLNSDNYTRPQTSHAVLRGMAGTCGPPTFHVKHWCPPSDAHGRRPVLCPGEGSCATPLRTAGRPFRARNPRTPSRSP